MERLEGPFALLLRLVLEVVQDQGRSDLRWGGVSSPPREVPVRARETLAGERHLLC